ncbi:MAG: acyl-CoA dehydrogenase family protein [Gammaproteobacteria bacterium]
MNFDFTDEQKQLRDSVRGYLDESCPSGAVRAVVAAAEGYDRTLWKGLADLGLAGAAIPEEFGGVGGGHLELCVIAEELGRCLAPVPFSSSIYLAAELILRAGSDAQKREHLPKVASGASVGTFALAESAGRITPAAIRATVAGGRLTGVKLPVPDGDSADFAVVAARGTQGDGIGLYLVDLAGPGVRRVPVPTVDPSRKHARLEFDAAPAEPLAGADGWRAAEAAIDAAAVLTAFEQVGGAERALYMARDYALDRMAFGRPIGSFQAIKHMLADMYVSATLARSNAYYGAWALSTAAAELPVAAATARVSATQAFQQCSMNNIQVHGGMGFTYEFDCHLYYRRSNLLAVSLGGLSQWESDLIARMRAARAA